MSHQFYSFIKVPLLILLVTVPALAQKPEPIIQTGHTAQIFDVRFSPDGAWLASAGSDQTVKIWERGTGRMLRSLYSDLGAIGEIAISPDRRWLAAAATAGPVTIWDVGSGATVRTIGADLPWTEAVAFSPDGRLLATGEGRTGDGRGENALILWDAATGARLRTLTGHQAVVRSIVFGPDGRLMASASGDQAVKIWEVATGKELRSFSGVRDPTSSVRLAISPDGTRLVGLKDDGLAVWDIESGRVIRSFERAGVPLAISPDGRYLATRYLHGSIRLLDFATGAEIREMGEHEDALALDFSPDGSVLAATTYEDKIKMWDVATGAALRTFGMHLFPVRSLAFSPDGLRADVLHRQHGEPVGDCLRTRAAPRERVH